MASRHPARTASALLDTTGAASASVIAARMRAFSDPFRSLSPWHQSEARRMGAEKLGAATDGMISASVELALMPGRMLLLATRPEAWTANGWLNACQAAAGLWIDVGNAALRPAARTAARNRTRLARRRG